MKPIYSIHWIALAILATAALAVQNPVAIRRELKEGSTETYKIENEVKQLIEIPSMGEQDMIMTTVATVAIKTSKVDVQKGIADVETLTKIEKAALEGSVASMMGQRDDKLPEPKAEKGTLDSRNRIVIAKDPKANAGGPGSGGIGSMMSMMSMGSLSAQQLLNLIELPEKSVALGEEIKIAMPGAASAASAGLKDLKLAMKIVGERELEGAKAWVVSYSGSFKIDMDTSKLPNDPSRPQNPMGDVTVTGTGQISGEGLVDVVTGKTISNSMNMKNDLKVLLQQMGMEMPVKGTISSKLSLVK